MSQSPYLTSDAVSVAGEPVVRLLRAAWIGVAIGLLLEGVLLCVQLYQDQMPELVRIVADTVQKVAWSSLVCVALAAGQAATQRNSGLAGLSGLLGAPIAFLLARSMHQATLDMLGAGAASATSPWLGAGLKGAEYALLGIVILWLDKRGSDWKSYAACGAAVGTASYALLSWLSPAEAASIQRAVVEIAHPAGCALAVHLSAHFARSVGARPDPDL